MPEKLLDIAVEELVPDVNQPRKTFNPEAIERLAMSIAKVGVQQPLRVIWDSERQSWLLLTGESRWRAAKWSISQLTVGLGAVKE